MKKFLTAILLITSVFTFIVPSYADDRVSLYGLFWVRAFDNTAFDGTDKSFIDQRLRLGTKINIADDVYVEMRADYGEGVWGQDYTGGLVSRPRNSMVNTIDIDRGFINIDKEKWSLRVGQQFVGLGVCEVLDANAVGAKLNLKLPVETSLIYLKNSENGSLNDDGANDDIDLYAINFGYNTDNFTVDLFGAMEVDGTDTDNSPLMVGLYATGSLGNINLSGEFDFATGDTDDGATDYMGTQLYLQGDVNITEAFNLGAELFYALGADDADEKQLTGINDWGSFTPMAWNTPPATYITAFYNWNSPFDPTGDSAGVQGVAVYGKYIVMDGLRLGGKAGYFKPENDDNTTTDDITIFNAWIGYDIATNTELSLTYLFSDYDDPQYAEEKQVLVAQLQVSF
ncbi:hypothetical protein [Desulfocicer niacini]